MDEWTKGDEIGGGKRLRYLESNDVGYATLKSVDVRFVQQCPSPCSTMAKLNQGGERHR